MHLEETKSFNVGDWHVSPMQGLVSREDESLRIEPKAVEVLAYLATRAGEVVSRDDLEKAVWPGALVGYDSVTKTVIKLRKALGDDARQPKYIETIPKRGYRLIAPVHYLVMEESQSKDSMEHVAAALKGNSGSGRLTQALLSVFGLSVIVGLAYLFMPEASIPDGDTHVLPPPSIIVLPFENLSEIEQGIAFADGITEDIITDLSGVADLQVLASNTAFALKGKKLSALDLRKELSVDYVLQGSIRRHEGSVRINARLVDARSGYQKWAKRYDRRVTEVFAVQDELTASIVQALTVRLSPLEKQRMASRTTNNLAAYDHFQEGQRLSKIGTRETNYLAEDAYRKAITEDPSYGRAYGALAYTFAYRYRRGWSDAPVHTIDRARELGKRAVELDDNIPQTHWALGYAYLMGREYEQAETAVERAIAIAPNYADGYGLLALIKNTLGDSRVAIELVKKGMLLNPYYTWDYPYNLGRAYYDSGQIDAAISTLEQARSRNQNALPVRLHLAASYARAGRFDDAEWEVEEIQLLNPRETISLLKTTLPLSDPKDMQMLVNDLRKAGLAE